MDLRAWRSRNLMELDKEENKTRYLLARGQRSVLARYEDVHAVLRTLRDQTPELYPERDALTRAIIAEMRRVEHPFWVAVLQVAYYPMLRRLRTRIRSQQLSGQEIDQIITSAFLETLSVLPIKPETNRTCMRLAQETKRRVFRVLREEQRYRHQFIPQHPRLITWLADQAYPVEGEDPTEHKERCLWPETKATPDPPMEPEEHERQRAFLDRYASSSVSRGGMDLVLATYGRGERLPDIARRMSEGATPEERWRIYERLRRRRHRSLARLRLELRHLRHADFAALLLEEALSKAQEGPQAFEASQCEESVGAADPAAEAAVDRA